LQQNAFGCRALPGPTGAAYSVSWILGVVAGKGGAGKGREEGKGEGRKGREGKGKEGGETERPQ